MKNNRAAEIVGFLVHKGWDNASQTPLQADFSTRRFARLERDEAPQRAVLMDADANQGTAQFVALAKILSVMEISAPQIYAADPERHLVLMEDLGDRNIGRLIDAGEDARLFYKRAVDVLVQLHTRFDPAMVKGVELPIFNAKLFATQVELFLDGYFVLTQGRAANDEESKSFREAWVKVLEPIDRLPRTLMLRDFMPDNLMDIPERKEWRSIGVLDFQDGGLGPAPYDLASLCEVVRRDGGDHMLNELIDYYFDQAKPKLSKTEFQSACRILAAQRHTRILGIIARRALETGNRDKLAYASRIWKYLDGLMKGDELKTVRDWMNTYMPAAQRGAA